MTKQQEIEIVKKLAADKYYDLKTYIVNDDGMFHVTYIWLV